MGAVATFNYTTWVTRYPEFSAVTPETAALYFADATLYLNNTGLSPVPLAADQLQLLNMLTAHIAATAPSAVGGGGVAGGPLTSATEGSVSATFWTASSMSAYEGWFRSTPYGAAFWQAMQKYFGFRYRPPLPRIAPYAGWGRRW